MSERVPVSKKLRFSVFERDDFTCQYCGKNPNEHDIVLEVDHGVSVFDGGDNSLENLVTACFDCNRGKGKKTSIKKVKTKSELTEDLRKTKERLEQVKMMSKYYSSKDRLEDAIFNEKHKYIKEILCDYSDGLIKKVIGSIKRQEGKNTSVEMIKNALTVTENKFACMDEFIITDFMKYFNGVIRTTKQEEADPSLVFIREQTALFYDFWNANQGGVVNYRLLLQVKEIFKNNWEMELLKEDVVSAIKEGGANPSKLLQEKLYESSVFYKQN